MNVWNVIEIERVNLGCFPFISSLMSFCGLILPSASSDLLFLDLEHGARASSNLFILYLKHGARVLFVFDLKSV